VPAAQWATQLYHARLSFALFRPYRNVCSISSDLQELFTCSSFLVGLDRFLFPYISDHFKVCLVIRFSSILIGYNVPASQCSLCYYLFYVRHSCLSPHHFVSDHFVRPHHSCYTPGTDSGVRGVLAVVGLACLVETGYWAMRAELIIYLC